jgi:hypothetical protein
MSSAGVVKTLYVRKYIFDGKLNVNVLFSDANLSIGRWRICVSQIYLTPVPQKKKKQDPKPVYVALTLKNVPLTVSLSTNRSQLNTVPSAVFGEHSAHTPVSLGPARFIICPVDGALAGIPFHLDFTGHWMELQNAANEFYLEFQNSVSDQPVPDGTFAQVILLLERIH